MTNDVNPAIAAAIATLLAAGQPKEAPPRRQQSLYTVPEAVEVLRMSRAWVYQAIAEGRIPSIQLGRRRMIPVSAIDAILAGDTAA